MEEIIARISQAANIDPETARKAIGMILNFIREEAPQQAQALIGLIPGANDMIAAATENPSEGGLGGMLGGLLSKASGSLLGEQSGNLVALGSQLLNEGLSMGQAQTVATELLEFGKKELGEERIAQITAAIPGLSKLV